MIDAGTAVLADVEGALEDEASRLERHATASAWWRGTAAASARRLWVEQARHLTRAAAALREAQQVLRHYEAEAEDARRRLTQATATLRAAPPLAQLLDPSGARAHAEAAELAHRRATADLDEAARRLAARLEALETEARMPAAAGGPCAPPPPAAPRTGWPRVAEAVFGLAEPVLWDVLRCRPVYLLEAGGASGMLRGLARTQAALRTQEQAVAAAAEGLLARTNTHIFKHSDQLFGHTAKTSAERLEWARLVGAALQSSKTFRYRSDHLDAVGRLHRQYDRTWVVVQDGTSGEAVTAFMPTARQLAAILRSMRTR